jgi:hypothetical protein
MSNDYEVIEKLGEGNVEQIINYARGGQMDDQQITDFTHHLGRPPNNQPDAPNVLFGNHSTRMSRDKDRRRDAELRAILSDWWDEELHDDRMSREEALGKLARILSSPDVGCRPLASKLQGTAPSAENRQGDMEASTLYRDSITMDTQIMSEYATGEPYKGNNN